MWFLVFSCVTAVVGVPLPPAKGAATSAPDNFTTTPTADVLPLTTVEMPTTSGPSQNESAETLAGMEEEVMVEQGDILSLEDRNAVKQLWANGLVPYKVSAELANRKADIAAAFRMISGSTCIHFKEHTNEINYLNIQDGQGCASYIGCHGGAQPVYFAASCSVGNLCHELMHALGMYHEHTRFDRDQYISVVWQSIKPGKKDNFDIKEGDTLNQPYDFGSIMHYGTAFFSKDGTPTIEPKQKGVDVGQRKRLSQLDIKKLNALYHCGGSQRKG